MNQFERLELLIGNKINNIKSKKMQIPPVMGGINKNKYYLDYY